MIKLTPALILLIVVNLIPVVGVLAFGWDMAMIIVLYWVETVIIGFINVPKLWLCEDGVGVKIFLTCFFAFHFGMFSGGHFVFLNAMFGTGEIIENFKAGGPIFWTALTLFLSHLFSMIVNFIGKKEYVGRTANAQMFFPYGRIVVMHIVIVLGGAITMGLGSPLFALILLIGLKIIMDIAAHSSEHGGKPMHLLK